MLPGVCSGWEAISGFEPTLDPLFTRMNQGRGERPGSRRGSKNPARYRAAGRSSCRLARALENRSHPGSTTDRPNPGLRIRAREKQIAAAVRRRGSRHSTGHAFRSSQLPHAAQGSGVERSVALIRIILLTFPFRVLAFGDSCWALVNLHRLLRGLTRLGVIGCSHQHHDRCQVHP